MSKILLIEDDANDARLIQTILKGTDSTLSKMPFVHTERLSASLQEVKEESFEVILMDLGLPDSVGLDGLLKMAQQAPDTPIIVLTGNEDSELAVQAIRAGAQDYLVKGNIDGELLTRTMRYAIERRQLLAELERAKQREQSEQEIANFERLSKGQSATLATKLYSLTPLKEAIPETFAEFVDRYSTLLNLSVKGQGNGSGSDVSDQLRSLAENIGFLKGGPRDVVEIHTATFKQITASSPQQNIALMNEGRLLILELMGHLAAFYRNYALAGPGPLNVQE